MLKKLKSLPVIGFFVRYYLILVLTILSVWITILGTLAEKYGAIIFGPELFFWALAAAVLGRHFLFGSSIDLFVATGKFKEAWDALLPEEKLDRSLICIGVMFIGACLVFAAVAK